MKQGPSNSQAGDQKREPIAKAVNLSSVADTGLQYVGKSTELYAGRGYEAPGTGVDTHHCGSQGKH